MLINIIEKYYEAKKNIFLKYFVQNQYSLKFFYNNNRHIIYINSKNINIKAEYEILGIYDTNNKYWTWSNSLPFIEKNLVKTSKHVRNYKNKIFDFLVKNNKNIYHYLNDSSFQLDNIDLLTKVMLYYSNGNWIIVYNNVSNNNILEFILIKNILNIY